MHGALFIYSFSSSSLRINPINQSVLCAVTIFGSFCDYLDYLVYYDYFCLGGWPEARVPFLQVFGSVTDISLVSMVSRWYLLGAKKKIKNPRSSVPGMDFSEA